jgi:hypothetical protein
MKTSKYKVLITALLFSLSISGESAFAQETDQEKAAIAKKIAVEKAIVEGKLAEPEAEGKIKAELFTVMGSKFGFETKLVKGAPYSAVAVSESVQTLGDGNRIRQTTSTTVYRDSAGRTRRETMRKDGTLQSIAISDPTTGINYILDPQNRTATKSEFAGMMKKVELMRVEDRRKIETENMLAASKTPANSVLLGKKRSDAEPLGRQTVEGVDAEGSRTTITIAAGQIGNDLPINIVSEQWYSPELQLLVITKHSDPRTGETTYRLTNINRAEPDRSLFEVPADYTVRNEMEMKKLEAEKMFRIKTDKPEEQ